MVDDVKRKKKLINGGGPEIKDLNSLIIANKKFTDGVSRKRAEDKWKKNVDNRSKVVKKNVDKK
jgi:hypothetical protein